MNTPDLLRAVFTDHEALAPDVARTRQGIEDELDQMTRRRPNVAVAAVGTAAAVVAVAATVAVIGQDSPETKPTHPVVAARQPASVSASTAHSAHPPRSSTLPFRAGWVPAGAKLNSVEHDKQGLQLENFAFGAVPTAERNLRVVAERGPLITSLRDGGTLRSTTIDGRRAVEGYSANGDSYTVSILQPDGTTATVVTSGFGRSIDTAYSQHVAKDLEFGTFPSPTPPAHPQ